MPTPVKLPSPPPNAQTLAVLKEATAGIMMMGPSFALPEIKSPGPVEPPYINRGVSYTEDILAKVPIRLPGQMAVNEAGLDFSPSPAPGPAPIQAGIPFVNLPDSAMQVRATASAPENPAPALPAINLPAGLDMATLKAVAPYLAGALFLLWLRGRG